MSREQLAESQEQLPEIRLTEMPELEDHPLFGREYELAGPVTVTGIPVVISGEVINHGDGADYGNEFPRSHDRNCK